LSAAAVFQYLSGINVPIENHVNKCMIHPSHGRAMIFPVLKKFVLPQNPGHCSSEMSRAIRTTNCLQISTKGGKAKQCLEIVREKMCHPSPCCMRKIKQCQGGFRRIQHDRRHFQVIQSAISAVQGYHSQAVL
jgi:hypothetical protein